MTLLSGHNACDACIKGCKTIAMAADAGAREMKCLLAGSGSWLSRASVCPRMHLLLTFLSFSDHKGKERREGADGEVGIGHQIS